MAREGFEKCKCEHPHHFRVSGEMFAGWFIIQCQECGKFRGVATKELFYQLHMTDEQMKPNGLDEPIILTIDLIPNTDIKP